DVEDVSRGARLAEHALEVDARAVGVRLAVHVQVGSAAGDTRLEGQGGVAGRVDAGHHVVGGSVLAHAPDGPARGARPGVDHVVEGGRRHHFDLGRPVDVHELDQEVLDVVRFQLVLQHAAVHDVSPEWAAFFNGYKLGGA